MFGSVRPDRKKKLNVGTFPSAAYFQPYLSRHQLLLLCAVPQAGGAPLPTVPRSCRLELATVMSKADTTQAPWPSSPTRRPSSSSRHA